MKKVLKSGTGEYIEKKSRFIGYICNIKDENQAEEIIAAIRKKYWDARHNCYAYILGDNNEIQKFSDDKEPSGTAGKPIMEVLVQEGLNNCLCVVTRYFGGVLLGTGGLVRAYGQATKEALNNCDIGELINGYHGYIDSDYNMMGKIQYICTEKNVTILNTDYSENVVFEVIYNKEDDKEFEKKLLDGSAGKMVIRDKKEIKICINNTGEVFPVKDV